MAREINQKKNIYIFMLCVRVFFLDNRLLSPSYSATSLVSKEGVFLFHGPELNCRNETALDGRVDGVSICVDFINAFFCCLSTPSRFRCSDRCCSHVLKMLLMNVLNTIPAIISALRQLSTEYSVQC